MHNLFAPYGLETLAHVHAKAPRRSSEAVRITEKLNKTTFANVCNESAHIYEVDRRSLLMMEFVLHFGMVLREVYGKLYCDGDVNTSAR